MIFLLYIYIFEIPIAKASFSLLLSFSPSDCLSVHLSLVPICCQAIFKRSIAYIIIVYIPVNLNVLTEIVLRKPFKRNLEKKNYFFRILDTCMRKDLKESFATSLIQFIASVVKSQFEYYNCLLNSVFYSHQSTLLVYHEYNNMYDLFIHFIYKFANFSNV